jgi:hypothetical protein
LVTAASCSSRGSKCCCLCFLLLLLHILHGCLCLLLLLPPGAFGSWLLRTLSLLLQAAAIIPRCCCCTICLASFPSITVRVRLALDSCHPGVRLLLLLCCSVGCTSGSEGRSAWPQLSHGRAACQLGSHQLLPLFPSRSRQSSTSTRTGSAACLQLLL